LGARQSSISLKQKKAKHKVFYDANYLEIKTRKPNQPNWANFEVLVLINAKKNEHEANLETINSIDNMETIATRWKHIFNFVMQTSFETY
jgi:hypothetical protein